MNADKASFKTVPVIGQIVEQFVHLFLVKKSSNSGERCKRAIKRTILYFEKVKSKVSLVLYPEGATLEENNIERSRKFAEKNGLDVPKRTLLPREAGFCQVIKNAEVDSIYEVTIGIPEFDDGKGGKPPLKFGLIQALSGKYPKTICMHIERYEVSDFNQNFGDSNRIIINEDTTREALVQNQQSLVLTQTDLIDPSGNTSSFLKNIY